MAVEQIMTDQVSSAPNTRAIVGITAICGGTFAFTLQDVLMKILLDDYSLWVLIAVRMIVSIVLLSTLIACLDERHRFRTPNFGIHLIRGFIMAICFIAFYAALPLLGLATIATITYSFPLFTAVLAAVFLKETVGWKRSLALVVGFAGVVVAIRPGSDVFDPVTLLPLITAVTYAVSLIMLRRMGESESTYTVALHTSITFCSFILLLGYVLGLMLGEVPGYEHLNWEWRLPPIEDAAILLLLGLCGVTGITLISKAYQIGPASFMAPFDYVYLAWAALLGFLIWDVLPDGYTMVGMMLIVGAGIYIGHREIKQLHQIKKARIIEKPLARRHG